MINEAKNKAVNNIRKKKASEKKKVEVDRSKMLKKRYGGIYG